MQALSAAGVQSAACPACRRRTFQPVRVEDTYQHTMHGEWARCRKRPRTPSPAAKRVVLLGTTALRLSRASRAMGQCALERRTAIFITPGFQFLVVDLLLTNFHLPRSTAFHAVAAFAGLERMKAAYAHAIASEYRFYSLRRCCFCGDESFFELLGTDGLARRGRITTAHGTVETPAFIRSARRNREGDAPQSVAETGTEIGSQHLSSDAAALAQTRGKARGLHKFHELAGRSSRSGGFQVMSSPSCANSTLTASRSVTGRRHIASLTPERSIEIQHRSTPTSHVVRRMQHLAVEEPAAAHSMRLSMKWAERGGGPSSAARAMGCSASSRASVFPACARKAPGRSPPSA